MVRPGAGRRCARRVCRCEHRVRSHTGAANRQCMHCRCESGRSDGEPDTELDAAWIAYCRDPVEACQRVRRVCARSEGVVRGVWTAGDDEQFRGMRNRPSSWIR